MEQTQQKQTGLEIKLFDSNEAEVLHIEGGVHVGANHNRLQQNQTNLDKSKKYTLNVENMKLAWYNPYNPEAVFYKRLPNVNDRPDLC